MSQSCFLITLFSIFQRKVMLKFHTQISCSENFPAGMKGPQDLSVLFLHLTGPESEAGRRSVTCPRSKSAVGRKGCTTGRNGGSQAPSERKVLEMQMSAGLGGGMARGGTSISPLGHQLPSKMSVLSLKLSLILFMQSHLPSKG